MLVRPELPQDLAAIRAVHVAAFPTALEADLVERLRANGHALISLVAEIDGQIVGHVLFSPVTLSVETMELRGLGLAPVAVVPDQQRRRVGTALIEEGLAIGRRNGCPFVVLLGHPAYYPRFGFRPASAFGLKNQFGADDAFMILELQPNSLPTGGGLVRYGPEFDEWVVLL